MRIRCIGRFLSFVVGGIAILMASSCERDELVEQIKLSSNKIIYSVGWADGSAITKADDPKKGETFGRGSEFLMTVGGDSLFLSFAQMPNIPPVQTKSAPIKNISSFYVAAFTEAGNPFISKDKINVDENGLGSSNRFWPEDNSLNFFAWENDAITDKLSLERSSLGCTGSFEYSLPQPGSESPYRDAENQPDLIFAITPDQSKTSNTENPGRVKMQFHHALSAIHFKVGNMPENLTVKSITLEGVYSGGECSFAPGNKTDSKPLNLKFDWTNQNETNTYTQDFNLGIPDDNRENLGTLDEITNADKKEAVFMMIPQEIPDDAVLEIVITVDDNSFTLSKKFSEISTNPVWEADKKYVYVISTPDQVDVEIEDQVTGNVKSDVIIKNTGMVPSYVRAAVVGYWILEREETEGDGTVVREDIVAAWNPASDGTFDGLPGSNWKAGSDGFYYYTLQVEPNAEITDKLFNTYTLTANPPVVGAQLRFSILVQSVMADRVSESGWPVTESGNVLSVNND